MSYTFQGPPDLSAKPPDLHQGLVMLLVDGRRGADEIVALSPMDAALTLDILEEIALFGVIRRGPEGPSTAEEPDAAPAEATAGTPGMGIITRKAFVQ